MEADTFEPLVGICKKLELRFSFVYSGDEFAHTMRQLIGGKIDDGKQITGKLGVEGVPVMPSMISHAPIITPGF